MSSLTEISPLREGLGAFSQPPGGSDCVSDDRGVPVGLLASYGAQTALFENGRVRLPSRASWLLDYVNELTSFPGSRYDDQVDSTTQALDHLHTKKVIYISPELLEKSRLIRRPNRLY
jgi:hypothetical protein